jgi:hypothetical protein
VEITPVIILFSMFDVVINFLDFPDFLRQTPKVICWSAVGLLLMCRCYL